MLGALPASAAHRSYDRPGSHGHDREANRSGHEPQHTKNDLLAQSLDRAVRFLGLADVRLIGGQVKVDRHEIRVEKRALAEVRLGIVVAAGMVLRHSQVP